MSYQAASAFSFTARTLEASWLARCSSSPCRTPCDGSAPGAGTRLDVRGRVRRPSRASSAGAGAGASTMSRCVRLLRFSFDVDRVDERRCRDDARAINNHALDQRVGDRVPKRIVGIQSLLWDIQPQLAVFAVALYSRLGAPQPPKDRSSSRSWSLRLSPSPGGSNSIRIAATTLWKRSRVACARL